MDDLTLARNIHNRDAVALDLLVERHHSAVFRFLRQLTRNIDDAEDLTQQTMVRAIVGAQRYDGRASFRAWILGIAFHEFTRFRRRKLWLPALRELVVTQPEFSTISENDALRLALTKLSPESRALLLLHHVEELTISEIAQSLGIPEGTVKSRMYNARERLKEYLGAGEENYVAETC